MSEINDKYWKLIGTHPWIGKPIGGEQKCSDNIGSFRDYAGNASIYYTPATGAHLICGYIRDKWVALGREKGPNGYPTSDEIDATSGLGRRSMFQHGTIIWKQGTTAAFTVYGAIYAKWASLQYDKGPLGFPLTDEASTTGNTARFNDFEHGAIYYVPSKGTHVVRSPILEAWTFDNREKGLFKFPSSDTPAAADADGNIVQQFQGGSISCKQGKSRSLVTSVLISPRIEPRSRALILEPNSAYGGNWGIAGIDDRRVCPLTRLNRHLRLRTALVIFRESYSRTLSDSEITDLKGSYTTAASQIHDSTFGLGQLDHTIMVATSRLKKADFKDDGNDPAVFEAKFNAYSKVIDVLADHGYAASDFDVVSICIPWATVPIDPPPPEKPSGYAWADPVFELGNNATRSTIHYIHPSEGPYGWEYFVHELTHCIDWRLDGNGYPDMRNSDDPWWTACYPRLYSSEVTPPPENLGVPGQFLLYTMLQRIKGAWLDLAPGWGTIKTDTTSLANYGQILMYSCPEARTFVETAWSTKYLPTTQVSCQKIATELEALRTERDSLQAELLDAAPGQKPGFAGQMIAINTRIRELTEDQVVCNMRAALANK